MDSAFASCALGATAFLSTNVDNLFVLLSFFADSKYRVWEIILGEYIGMGLLYLTSTIASAASMALERRYVGLLGLVPIIIGARRLLEQLRRRRSHERIAGIISSTYPIRRSGTVVAAALANGGDNVGVYIPLFAVHTAGDIAVMGSVFFLLTGAWCASAYWLVRHPTLGAPIRAYSRIIMPIMLIGLGLLIIGRAAASGL
jgi:cadmium resistance protein CadD (predicted permease)